MRKLIFLILCSVAIAQNPYRSLNNFNSGELSPLLSAREDLAKYQNGCSIMENLIPLPQGGAQKRPGTKYIAEVKTSSLKTRLLPFEFSTSQSYIIEVGNQYMRFYTDSAVINQGSGTEDLSDIDNVIAHWKLNDDAANTAVDDDIGVVPHDGTASSNTEDMTTAGIVNAALDFAGTETVDVADDDALSFGNSTTTDTAFSIAGWMFATAGGAQKMILSKWKVGGFQEWQLFTDADNKLVCRLRDETDIATITMDDGLNEAWHFVCVTYAGQSGSGSTAANFMKLYVDGVLVTDVTRTTSAGYEAMHPSATIVVIGGRATTGANDGFWLDKLDNLFMTSDVLTADEISDLYDGGSTTPLEITTPYLTADLFELKFEQSADVLYIVHPDYETRKLSRTADAAWTLEVAGITTGPFRTQNTEVTKTISSSGTTDTVTLTASGHNPFVADTTNGHIPNGSDATDKAQTGALFKLVHPLDDLEFKEELESDFAAGQVEDTSWVDCGILYKGSTWTLVTGDTWFGTIKVQRNYTIGAAVGSGGDEGASVGWETVFPFSSGAGATVDARNVSTTGTEDDGDAQYRVIYADEIADDTVSVYFSTDQTEVTGIVKITAVASATSATGTVIRTLGSTDATHKWCEGSWSNYRGWPQTVTFYEDRLCFGGNTAQPDTIWASVTSDYENMTAGPDDDEALIFTLSSRQVNVIEWIIGKDKLLIGTSGAEWTIAGGTDEPLTPSNAITKQHSTYGSANLQATLANESVLFFQRGAEKMRELAYNWELDSYVAPDMTILANLVTRGGIVDTAFQKTPDSILWCVRADGELPLFSYERKENITAWSRMVTTDGTGDSDFESIARIPGSPEDEIWVVVKRTIDSNSVRYIEQFQPRDFGTDADDAYYVDCGITYDDPSASSAMTGLLHLKGETVYVLADGVVFDTEVVSASGEITLSLDNVTTTASTVQMGLAMEVNMRTMPLSWVSGDITIQGRIKRISEVIANWYVSGDFSVGRDVDTLQTVSISGQTTFQDRVSFPPGYDRNGYVYVWQKSPEPLTILALIMEFGVD